MRTLFTWYGNALLNPRTRLWVLLGSLVYLLSPIDISPDLIPFAGQIDDVVLLMMVISGLSQLFSQRQGLTQPLERDDDREAEDADRVTQTINVDAVEIK
ncbi:MAG: DUF1232 domain-containing protein [Cyanobacteria bacterium]|nr:DUF1232 domain-containing protein [Cyanobacteriota bacterium]MDW8199998.1 DUF1232 domain-containing protein [Cyanobacteriota bacterium SKYGB_h_bin112]